MCKTLESEGYAVDVFHSVADVKTVDMSQFSLFIIDMNLGSANGIKLAYALKQNRATARTPLIFCSSPDESNVIKGLDFGADDYMLKPFSMRELAVRVNAILHRSQPTTSALTLLPKPRSQRGIVMYHALSVDLNTHHTFISGESVKLARDEERLLEFLLTHKGRSYDAQEIYDQVWPEKQTVSERYIDKVLDNLRTKIDPYGHHLTTGPNYGFKQ